MSATRPIRLPAVDRAWLRMEQPNNLMTIAGVLRFAAPLDWEKLRRLLQERVLCYERFRLRMTGSAPDPRRARFERLDRVDLDEHLHRVRLAAPADETRLQEFVSERMSTPLDYSRPLWECHYVENLVDGSALVCRLHHCLADGMSLIQVLLQLADEVPDGMQPTMVGRKSGRAGALTPERPSLPVLAVRGLGILGRLFTMRRDPPTPLRGPLQPRKKAVWSAPLDLERIKGSGRALGGTVNDVLLAAVAGALRTYLEGRGVRCDDLDLRAVVPVNLRGPGELSDLGNRFGLVFLALPVGLADPRDRFRMLKRRMDSIKQSHEPVVVYLALRALGAIGSAWLQEKVIRHLSSKSTAVMTNVPGPRRPLYLCGEQVREIMVWVPQSGGVGLGISVLSYVDHVRIGVASDVGLIPDPEAIVAAFEAELGGEWRPQR